MSLTVKQEESKEFEKVPAGMYIARCFRLIDLGTQEVTYEGKTKQQAKVLLGWELLDGLKEDGSPHLMFKRYTASLNEASNLYADLNSWRGKTFTEEELNGFELSKVVGAYCLINVIHDKSEKTGKEYAEIAALVPLKGEKLPPVNSDEIFDLDKPDMSVFEKLSENLQETIKKSPEWKTYELATGPAPKPAAAAAPKTVETAQEAASVLSGGEDDLVALDDIPF